MTIQIKIGKMTDSHFTIKCIKNVISEMKHFSVQTLAIPKSVKTMIVYQNFSSFLKNIMIQDMINIFKNIMIQDMINSKTI